MGQRFALWPGLPHKNTLPYSNPDEWVPVETAALGPNSPKVNFGATFPIPPIQSPPPVQAAEPPPLDAEAADPPQGAPAVGSEPALPQRSPARSCQAPVY